MDNNVIAGIAAMGALIAGGTIVYFLARDEDKEVIPFDPEYHNQELLIKLMEDIEIEYTSTYMHWYSMLKTKQKETGNVPKDLLDAVKNQIEELTSTWDEEIFAKYKIDDRIFKVWFKEQGGIPQISQLKSKLEKNYERLFKIQKPEFEFKYPKELTEDLYKKYIKIAYSKFRYDIYHHVQKILRKSGKNKLNVDEFNDALKLCSLPQIKTMVYRKMKIPEIPNEEPNKTWLKAYLMMMQNEDWYAEISHIQRVHKKILFDIPEGVKMNDMIDDPIEILQKEMEQGQNNNIKGSEEKILDTIMTNAKEVKSEESKKSFGRFSFMGNKSDQEQLISEFLNRNKKSEAAKQDEVEKDAAKQDEEEKDAAKQDEEEKDVAKQDEEEKDAAKQDEEEKDATKQDEVEKDATKQDEMEKDAAKEEIKDAAKDDNKDSTKDNVKDPVKDVVKEDITDEVIKDNNDEVKETFENIEANDKKQSEENNNDPKTGDKITEENTQESKTQDEAKGSSETDKKKAVDELNIKDKDGEKSTDAKLG